MQRRVAQIVEEIGGSGATAAEISRLLEETSYYNINSRLQHMSKTIENVVDLTSDPEETNEAIEGNNNIDESAERIKSHTSVSRPSPINLSSKRTLSDTPRVGKPMTPFKPKIPLTSHSLQTPKGISLNGTIVTCKAPQQIDTSSALSMDEVWKAHWQWFIQSRSNAAATSIN